MRLLITAACLVSALVVTGFMLLTQDAALSAGGALDLTSLHPEDIGEGQCVPDPVVVTHLVDCRFPLAGSDVGDGIAQAVVEGPDPIVAGEGRSWPCRLEDGKFVCERLVAASVGGLSIGVDLDGSMAANRATVTVLPYDLPAEIRIMGQEPGMAYVPVVATDHPVEIEARRRLAEGPIWLLVRSWPGRSQVASLQLLNDSGREAVVELTLGEPGQYELVLCNGHQPDTCVEDASGKRLQAIDPIVQELSRGHNLAGGNRMNVVVTGGGWESVERLAEVAQVLFDPSAEPILSPDGSALWWPPFTIEPLASSAYRFNLWLLPDQIDPLGIVQGAGYEPGVAAAFELEDAAFVHLQSDPVRLGGWAELPSFWQLVTAPGPSDEVVLGSAVVFLDPAAPFEGAQGVAHELGHSLFGLIDEYQRDAPFPKLAPPNCAEDRAQADQWWGDLIGEGDPQSKVYRSALKEHGLWTVGLEDTLEDDVTVRFVDGWCLAGSPDAVIPTRRSLMNDNLPVFGAVNRRHVDMVLRRWTGTAPLAAEHLPDALTSECTVTAATTVCHLLVAPLLTEPSESIRIRVGGEPAACSFPPPTDREPTLVMCPGVDRLSDTLEASVDRGPWVKLVDLPPVEHVQTTGAPPPATTKTAPIAQQEAASAGDSGDGPRTAMWAAIWIALTALVAVTVAARQIRRRRKGNVRRP